jgi:GTP-binding protein
VCDMSGTTRDAVDTDVKLPNGQSLKLIDTAGIRKRTKVSCLLDHSRGLCRCAGT